MCTLLFGLGSGGAGAGRRGEGPPGRQQTPLAGAARMAQASKCRNPHLYYYSVKFALSTYATLFSILGLVILCVGIYAEVERQKHKTLEGIFLAPAIILLLLGFTMFGVSFVGMVGSLRDNRTLLKTFFWVLLVIFLTELLLILIEIIFEKKMNAVFHSNIQEGIRHYYDDLDFKNILDFVQEKFSCCGGDEYRDWEVNQYHSCNGSGPLACGVPYTCCIRKVPGEVINTLCGYKTLDKERLELLNIIHVRGCIHAVGLWLKDNFEATLGIVCSLLLPQDQTSASSVMASSSRAQRLGIGAWLMFIIRVPKICAWIWGDRPRDGLAVLAKAQRDLLQAGRC
ncbi:tetraspanin-15 isoform X2 [Tyto alba]|uniref:tetraspanin-15 isoform X2 n=1 Tax=Tyto alba TaxID=56313 RepID=UPI001403C05A|nr:tetraspanin-15 isoform X2 [Tyto alba]